MLDDSYQIVGRLGADPELSRNGKNTIMFSVCINKTVSGEKVEKWVNCFISDKSTRLKNVAQYLKKGKNVLIEGSPFASHYLKDNKIITYSPEKKPGETFGKQRDNLYKAFISKKFPNAEFKQYGEMIITVLPNN